MQELPQSSFAEKLRDAGMSEFEIGWVCSKLVEEQFDLNETKYVGRDMGKTELKTIENYLWNNVFRVSKNVQFKTLRDFGRTFIDWDGMWVYLVKTYGFHSVRLPDAKQREDRREESKPIERYCFVRGANRRCTNPSDINEIPEKDRKLWGDLEDGMYRDNSTLV
jgi:hypothetical protein